MIFKKEPLIKKLFAILVVGLILMLFLVMMNSFSFIKQLPDYGTKATPDIYQAFIKRTAAAAFFIIVLNIALFWGMGKYAIQKLEKLSLTIDRIMDGDFSTVANTDEEGIFSRLESQFHQMSRRLQLGMESITREKEDLKSLVTDISHQIKTPLASVKIFNSLLMEDGLSKQEEIEFLNRIKEQIYKLEWLSASLIKISRMETGMIELKKGQEDIKQTILKAVNEVYLRALERNVDINIQNLHSILVCHDFKWTKEAIVNILENSIKYLHENGQVNVTTEKLETHIKIDIKDNGIGIPSHEIGKVFNRFYRGEADIVKKTEGSGIGLYLTRKIIEDQGGGIIVTSEDGQGTKFTILLTL